MQLGMYFKGLGEKNYIVTEIVGNSKLIWKLRKYPQNEFFDVFCYVLSMLPYILLLGNYS